MLQHRNAMHKPSLELSSVQQCFLLLSCDCQVDRGPIFSERLPGIPNNTGAKVNRGSP